MQLDTSYWLFMFVIPMSSILITQYRRVINCSFYMIFCYESPNTHDNDNKVSEPI